MKRINLLGKSFNSLTVIEDLGIREYASRKWYFWKCRCKCGKVTELPTSVIRTGKTKSCGCLIGKTIKHGKSRSSTRNSWRNMKQRCYNPNNHNYRYYGARGIKVCKRWLNSFENFLEDMGERPKGMTLDRKNSNGNYKKSNCRWADSSTQRANQRPRV